MRRRSCTLTDAISLFIGWDDGLTQFLIKVQSTGKGYDLIKSFFHRDEITFVATDGKHSVEPVAAVTNIVAG